MMTLPAALERMQPKAGKIHTVWATAPIQRCQDTPEFRHVSRCYAGGVSFLIQFFQAAMPKRLDHWQIVWCLSTVVNKWYSGKSLAESLSGQDRRDVFQTAAGRLDTLANYVVKDFRVCVVLDALFNGRPALTEFI